MKFAESAGLRDAFPGPFLTRNPTPCWLIAGAPCTNKNGSKYGSKYGFDKSMASIKLAESAGPQSAFLGPFLNENP